MSEGEVVSELVEFTNILMVGVSLIFSIVSAYVVALNYFIGSSNFMARLGSFAFMTLILGMLMAVMIGAESTHSGLIARLHELQAVGQLTAAGDAVLANSAPEWAGALSGHRYSVDELIRICVWAGLAFVYAALAYLTFLHPWQPDVVNVKLEQDKK